MGNAFLQPNSYLCCHVTPSTKGPRKQGNIVAETLLRKHCFLATQTGKHLLKKQNVPEKSQKHFLFPGSKKCFRNKCFLPTQTGKQQCFRNNVSSFAGALTAAQTWTAFFSLRFKSGRHHRRSLRVRLSFLPDISGDLSNSHRLMFFHVVTPNYTKYTI